MPHSHASASHCPSGLTDAPINWLHSEASHGNFLWHPSQVEVTGVKRGLGGIFGVLWVTKEGLGG